jgi:hypothetical protein
MTCHPRATSIPATVDLPQAMPPVRAMWRVGLGIRLLSLETIAILNPVGLFEIGEKTVQSLFYYFKPGVQPFRSLMELPNLEAGAFMRTHLPEDVIFHRDPEGYLKRRRETEDWLHKTFCDLGGNPLTLFPIYMTLGKSSYIESQGIYTECLELPLSLFSENVISFTYPDSYVSHWLAETQNSYFDPSTHGRVFKLPDLCDLLSDGRVHNDAWKVDERRYDFFLEAQIWDPTPLAKFIRS